MTAYSLQNALYRLIASIGRKREIILGLALTLATLAAYWPVYQFGFVNYDDNRYVFENSRVQAGLSLENAVWAFHSLEVSNWHPLTWLSLMLDAQLFGLEAGGYHVINLLFHLLNTLLLYIVLSGMTGLPWRSAAVAVLFALHPLHVESVAWIAERKDVLSTFFLLLTIWAYTRYVRRPGLKTYFLVALFFALGLTSKPMVVTLPFILLLLDLWPLRRISPAGRCSREGMNGTANRWARLILEKLPLFALTVLSVAVTLLAQQSEIAAMQRLPLSLRISNALVAYCGYLAKTLWPHPLAVLYPHPEFIPAWQATGAAALLAVLTILAVTARRRHPYVLVGWLWYLGTLVPVIGLVQVGVQAMADRYTYIPLIGIFIAAVWLVSEWAAQRDYLKSPLAVIGSAIAGLFFMLTSSQLNHWQNSQTLFSNALSVTQNNYVIHNNMGAFMASQGKLDEATAHYRAALRIRPDNSETHYNLGNLLLRQGKLREAIPHYEEALSYKPDLISACNNLGIAYAQAGEQAKAVEQFRAVLKRDPDHQQARGNLALALESLKKASEAVPPHAAAPVRSNPPAVEESEESLAAGISLAKKGDLVGAIDHFRKTLQYNPDHYEAHVHLGLSLAMQRNLDEAIPHFRKAIILDPKRPEPYNSLGVALANTGKIDEGITQLQEAIRINPDFAKAHNSLGVVLAKSGRIDEGLSHLREALRLQPDYNEAARNLEIVQGLKGRP